VFNYNEDRWSIRFDCLQEFFAKYGHLNISIDYIDSSGCNLYNWVRTQNRYKCTSDLSSDRILKLESLHYWSWTALRERTSPEHYEKNFQRLVEYLRIHKNPPHHLSKLGKWYQKQKSLYGYGELLAERVELFHSADITLETKVIPNWDCQFNELAKLKEIPSHNSSLGHWCYKQKTNYRDKKLNPDKFQKLNALTFWDWSILAKGFPWSESFKLMKAFIKKHNRFPKRREPLGAWFFKQRRKISEGNIKSQEYELLKKLPNWQWFKN
jgi:hypothetical protein